MAYPCVSFLTDYGTADGYPAACHGVIARLVPSVRVIDVTHEVPPHDVRRGAAVLAQVVPYLPPAVHLAVVDPGVGTARRGVAVVTERGVLVGPDNGLLGPAADALGGATAAHELTDPRYRLPHVSSTFHGRDVFAPAAAHLAAGLDPAALGPPVPTADLVRLPMPIARLLPVPPGEPAAAEAEVVSVDRFGNVALAAGRDLLAAAGLVPGTTVELGTAAGAHRLPYGSAFGSVAEGAPLLLVDSGGAAAVAVNRGSAASTLSLTVGDVVRLRRAPE
ncbi:MAG: S-adenosyl-l-methionine hydroxide adenosyltransferase family protein [Frankiaceae bacterium]